MSDSGKRKQSRDDDDEEDMPSMPLDTGLPHILVKEGVLSKKSPKGLFKVWQDRFFRLFTDGLEYSKKKGDNALGFIPITSITLCEMPDKKKKPDRFDVLIGDRKNGRVFSLVTKPAEEAQKWVDLITKQVKEANMSTSAPNSPPIIVNSEQKLWKVSGDKRGTMSPLSLQAAAQAAVAGSANSHPANSAARSSHSSSAKEQKANDITIEMRLQLRLLRDETPASLTAFGSLYRAVDDARLRDGDCPNTFLVHVVKKNDANYALVCRVMELMNTLKHPLIMSQIYRGESSDAAFAVYAPAVGADASVLTLLEQHRKFPEDVCRFFVASVIVALEYLHKQPASSPSFFRNLSPHRLFVNSDGLLCLSDVLLALPMALKSGSSELPAVEEEREENAQDAKGLSLPALSAEYSAPDDVDSSLTDLWRLGVLMYEMAVGVPPFRSRAPTKEARDAEIKQAIADYTPEKLRFPPSTSPALCEVIRRLLINDPSQRLSLQEVRESEWMKESNINWEALANTTDKNAGLTCTFAPDWVKSNVYDNKFVTRQKTLQLYQARYQCALKVELHGAKNLAPPAKVYYCKLMCQNRMHTFPTTSCTVAPEWASPANKCRLEVHAYDGAPSGEVVLELLCENPSKGEAVCGSVQLSLSDVYNSYPHPLSLSQTLIDANGFPMGEIQVTYIWEQTRLPQPTVFYGVEPLAAASSSNAPFTRQSSFSITSASRPASSSLSLNKASVDRSLVSQSLLEVFGEVPLPEAPKKTRKTRALTVSSPSSAPLSPLSPSSPSSMSRLASSPLSPSASAMAGSENKCECVSEEAEAEATNKDPEPESEVDEKESAEEAANADLERLRLAEEEEAEAEAARKQRAEEEAALEAARKEREEEEARLRLVEEQQQREAAEAAQRAAEEEARVQAELERIREEEEAARKQREEEEAQALAKQEAIRKEAQEKEEKRLAEIAAMEQRRQAEEEERKRQEEEEERLMREEEERLKAEEDEALRKEQEQLAEARRKLLEEKKAIEAARRKAQLELEKRKLEEERKQLEDERLQMEDELREIELTRKREEDERRVAEERRKLAEKRALEESAAALAIERAKLLEEVQALDKARLEREHKERLLREQEAQQRAEKEARDQLERELKSKAALQMRQRVDQAKAAVFAQAENVADCKVCGCKEFKSHTFRRHQCASCFHEHE